MEPKATSCKVIEVAAGVLADATGRVLMLQRLPGKHLAGLWEFPGGKLEPGETIAQALARELCEELGIEARAFEPVITVPWRYPEKTVRLHTLRVTAWQGAPRGVEGNPLRWIEPDAIDVADVPPADRAILAALRLPRAYVISRADGGLPPASGIATQVAAPLVQLRMPGAARNRVRAAALRLLREDASLWARLLVNGDIELARELGVGVHLRAAQLVELQRRPLPAAVWVGASCHDAGELRRAAELGVDFATLSPVRATPSHPDAAPLGWLRFAELVADAALPVLALGGLGVQDIDRARAVGAQGVAGIRAFAAVG